MFHYSKEEQAYKTFYHANKDKVLRLTDAYCNTCEMCKNIAEKWDNDFGDLTLNGMIRLLEYPDYIKSDKCKYFNIDIIKDTHFLEELKKILLDIAKCSKDDIWDQALYESCHEFRKYLRISKNKKSMGNIKKEKRNENDVNVISESESESESE